MFRRSARLRKRHDRRRLGGILVLTLVVFPLVIVCCAMAIDIGQIMMVKAQLQNAADSAAMAAAGRALDERGQYFIDNPYGNFFEVGFRQEAKSEAELFAGRHKAGNKSVALSSGDDIEFIYVDPTTREESTFASRYNSVRVRARRDKKANGPLPMTFARLFGFDEAFLVAEAQATFFDEIAAVGPPPPGQKNTFMPFGISEDHWKLLLASQTTGASADLNGDSRPDIADNYGYNTDMEATTNTSDGVMELRLYPDNSSLTAGNFGTLELGGYSSGTSTLTEQILGGLDEEDFSYHGGKFDFSQPFTLQGNTGISTGMQQELEFVYGEERTIFIYSQVENPGSNATFTIVGLAGIRIVKQDLNGNNKGVWIQPAPVTDPGAIPGAGPPNYNVYTPVHLTQ